MEEMLCPKTPACPIFNGILKGTEFTEVYKRQYCEAGPVGRNRCRRYQVANTIGKCPPNILPNSSKTVEQIIDEMKQSSAI